MRGRLYRTGVFALESIRPEDEKAGKSELALNEGLLKLLGVPHVVRTVRNKADLIEAGRLFDSGIRDTSGRSEDVRPFGVLLVSAHGDDQGIQLRDLTIIEWRDLFGLFHFGIDRLTVVLSSCSAAQGSTLHAFLESGSPTREDLLRGSPRPRFVFGYRDKVPWDRAALATCLLVDSENSDDRTTESNAIAIIMHHLKLPVIVFAARNIGWCKYDIRDGRDYHFSEPSVAPRPGR
jgi:hypothetical protein